MQHEWDVRASTPTRGAPAFLHRPDVREAPSRGVSRTQLCSCLVSRQVSDADSETKPKKNWNERSLQSLTLLCAGENEPLCVSDGSAGWEGRSQPARDLLEGRAPRAGKRGQVIPVCVLACLFAETHVQRVWLMWALKTTKKLERPVPEVTLWGPGRDRSAKMEHTAPLPAPGARPRAPEPPSAAGRPEPRPRTRRAHVPFLGAHPTR